MESVAVMAVTVSLSPGSVEHRKHVLAKKLRSGYELDSESEFGAVVFTRRWLWMQSGRDTRI